ncbi:hypothetical protein SAMN02745163_01671 [Clostridium cavendishii DSM 21758]|uniref:Uncharacterized protein n=1 Tax=Clostridium cavendishii DSM 21758 TaxID=1121302 RepID=A0A1M6I2I0_9CLOT|nr:hypothetical protein [Clostridium cavendishii]SHJ28668.1 hypothetical protein SAMN02745163_01671 [Clostridium cavendishii DSM 21758]
MFIEENTYILPVKFVSTDELEIENIRDLINNMEEFKNRIKQSEENCKEVNEKLDKDS